METHTYYTDNDGSRSFMLHITSKNRNVYLANTDDKTMYEMKTTNKILNAKTFTKSADSANTPIQLKFVGDQLHGL
jgi:hypothetical protein